MTNQVSLKKVVLALVVAGAAATGAHAATISGDASANVLTPLSVTQNTAMNFGDVSGDKDSSTTVVLGTDGSATPSVGAWAGGTPTAAQFTVAGAAGASYTLTLAGGSDTISLTSGANSLTVTSLTHTSTGTLSLAGNEIFTVGGTLNLGANQAAGNYTGTYTVEVAY